ncbi:uncharacterized protein [Atheta coriaria]|uniref:uncharacterized protein n=1 Tax=Dalotia coriaria TaxID=877792 RepID=UPI0031F3C22D
MTSIKYAHVESKVRKYIKDMKDLDEAGRQRRRLEQIQYETDKKCHPENHNNDEKQVIEKYLYDDLLNKYNDAKDENKFLKKIVDSNKTVDINDGSGITLINDSDFVHTNNSTICSNDFSHAYQSMLNNNVNPVGSNNIPYLRLEDAAEQTRESNGKSITFSCRKTFKKVLRKFACTKGDESSENVGDTTINMQPLNTMPRIHTPNVQKSFAKGANFTSTPGASMQKRMFNSARKASGQKKAKVVFFEDNGAQDQSAQAKRLIQNLNEVKDFLATL